VTLILWGRLTQHVRAGRISHISKRSKPCRSLPIVSL